jgi:LytR cell envelope-related transcriptional attenuator
LVLLTVLAAAAAVIWIQLVHREQRAARQSCPLSERQFLETFATVEPSAPSPPGAVEVRVLNATNRRGLAAEVASGLRVFGFSEAASLGNDVLHPPGTMTCVGQIRFGAAGRHAANTLSVVLPCAQLVRDERADNTVDLVLGNAFGALDPNPSARTVLEQLRTAPLEGGGGLQSVGGPDARVLLVEAHRQEC